MKELGIRVTSGLIGIILLIFVVFKGGLFLSFSAYIIAMIGIRELYKAMENIQIKPIYLLGYLWTTVLFLNTLLEFNYFELILALTTIVLLISIVLREKIEVSDISMTILGMIYIPFLLFHVVKLDGSIYIWLIFIISFGTDTFAYIAGNLFGKNKLCPKVSPNKTVEGSIGGIIGSSTLVIIFSLYFNLGPLWKMVILSIICSTLAQLGDLVASKIKRLTGIKDYGFIMPGHGGALDRFDSIIFTAPVVYYYIISFLI